MTALLLDFAPSPCDFAIDPGNEDSAYALVDPSDARPVEVAKLSSEDVRLRLHELAAEGRIGSVAIEMVRSYGMAVGADVFETCVWIGRFQQTALDLGLPTKLVYRGEVKLHLCHSTAAKDGNVITALVDRFAPGAKNRGKGTKDTPGWFYGFAGDMWQAYALAVLEVDRATGNDL